MPLPRTARGKAKVIWSLIKGDRDPSLSVRRIRARDFEDHARKYYERKYGKKHVRTQKHSRHTGRSADIAVNY